MKLSDGALVQAIWENQLRLLSRGVIDFYVGGGVGVCKDDEFNYQFASSEHRNSRDRVTTEIGRQQLLSRLRALRDRGTIQVYKGGCDLLTFMLPGGMAREAFHDARNWWLSQGVPTGFEGGKAKTVPMEPLQSLYEQARENLEAGDRDPANARVMIEDWRRACIEAGMPRQRFSELRQKLPQQSMVVINGHFVSLP